MIQTLCMFVGEFGCLMVFFYLRHRDPIGYKNRAIAAEEAGKKPIRLLQVLVPASCDFLASAMAYIALNFIPGSVYQMLKGGGLITTAIFSYMLMKKKIKRNHICGCVLALVGILIVGASNLIFNSSSSSSTDTVFSFIIKALEVLGYILMLSSLTFNGFFYSYEQKIFN
jgi:drug/metabolite transporter (DMT)-like permease